MAKNTTSRAVNGSAASKACPEPLLLDHAIECRREHDDEQADEPDLGKVEGQGHDQDAGGQGLNDQGTAFARRVRTRPRPAAGTALSTSRTWDSSSAP